MKKVYLACMSLFVFGMSSAQYDNSYLPVDKEATPETKNLLINLKKQLSQGIMFGHQDDLLYGHGWKYENGRSDVKSVCGDFPAVYGWELGKIEIGSDINLDSVPFTQIINQIKGVYSRGAVNTVSWHADNLITEGGAWDTTRVVSSILPGGKNHQLFVQRLDRLAIFFLNLKDDKGNPIPLIFRPYHEHSGIWFWWGSSHCSPEEYTKLYRFTIDYLRKVKGVHNLLIAFSPDRVKTKHEYFERYPGDDYVDILGIDVYCWNRPNGTDEYISTANTDLTIITEAAKEKNKLAAFTETGLEQLPNPKWYTEVLWKTISKYPISYVLVWRNAYNRPNHYYTPYNEHPSVPDFVEFYKLPGTLFQSDISKVSLYK